MHSFYLYGEINDELTLRFNKFVREKVLGELSTIGNDLIIYINSDGGDFTAALAIVDMIEVLRQNNAKITTVIDGKAYSAGAFIFCFGDERVVHTHSQIMMHPVFWENTEQNLYEIKAAADFISIEYLKFLNDIITHCNLQVESAELYDKLTRNWWLNSEEALANGIATKRAI